VSNMTLSNLGIAPRPGTGLTTQRPRWPGRCRGFTMIVATVLATTAALARPAAAAADRVAADGPAADVVVVRLPPGGVQPQAAVDDRGRVHVVYFAGDPAAGDVFYARLDGRTLSTPVRVNRQPGSAIAMGTVRGPHMAVGRGGRVHVAWMGSAAATPRVNGKAAPMLYARSTAAGDGTAAGDAFEPERNVIRGAVGLDGGGSVAADRDGNVYVAWHAPPAGTVDGGEAARTVWVARSADDGATFAPERAAVADGSGTCACCGMRAAAGPDGRVYLLYRNATDAVNRDVRLLASADHGQTFAVAAADPWNVSRCVMSTAAFAPLPGAGGVVAAWETKSQIRFARLAADASGQVADAESRVVVASVPGTGPNRKHPAAACDPAGNVLIAWTEGTAWSKGGTIVWQRFDPSGRPAEGGGGRAAGLPAWGAPAVVSNPGGGFTILY
jgi:hypothetical protein